MRFFFYLLFGISFTLSVSAQSPVIDYQPHQVIIQQLQAEDALTVIGNASSRNLPTSDWVPIGNLVPEDLSKAIDLSNFPADRVRAEKQQVLIQPIKQPVYVPIPIPNPIAGSNYTFSARISPQSTDQTSGCQFVDAIGYDDQGRMVLDAPNATEEAVSITWPSGIHKTVLRLGWDCAFDEKTHAFDQLMFSKTEESHLSTGGFQAIIPLEPSITRINVQRGDETWSFPMTSKSDVTPFQATIQRTENTLRIQPLTNTTVQLWQRHPNWIHSWGFDDQNQDGKADGLMDWDNRSGALLSVQHEGLIPKQIIRSNKTDNQPVRILRADLKDVPLNQWVIVLAQIQTDGQTLARLQLYPHGNTTFDAIVSSVVTKQKQHRAALLFRVTQKAEPFFLELRNEAQKRQVGWVSFSDLRMYAFPDAEAKLLSTSIPKSSMDRYNAVGLRSEWTGIKPIELTIPKGNGALAFITKTNPQSSEPFVIDLFKPAKSILSVKDVQITGTPKQAKLHFKQAPIGSVIRITEKNRTKTIRLPASRKISYAFLTQTAQLTIQKPDLLESKPIIIRAPNPVKTMLQVTDIQITRSKTGPDQIQVKNAAVQDAICLYANQSDQTPVRCDVVKSLPAMFLHELGPSANSINITKRSIDQQESMKINVLYPNK